MVTKIKDLLENEEARMILMTMSLQGSSLLRGRSLLEGVDTGVGPVYSSMTHTQRSFNSTRKDTHTTHTQHTHNTHKKVDTKLQIE